MGVASNRVDVKVAAARAERALERVAEPASALFLPVAAWPERLLAEAWLGVIRNAAHDSVCACSHDEVVDAVLHRYAEARQIGEGLAARAVTALGASVPHDGPVVVNLSSRARSGLVELIVPGEGEPPGCQLLRVRPAEADLGGFGSVGMAAGIVAELEYVTRYSAAAIVDATNGDVLFTAERSHGGQLIGPDDRAELERLMADGGAARPVLVRVRQVAGRKVLAPADRRAGLRLEGLDSAGPARERACRRRRCRRPLVDQRAGDRRRVHVPAARRRRRRRHLQLVPARRRHTVRARHRRHRGGRGRPAAGTPAHRPVRRWARREPPRRAASRRARSCEWRPRSTTAAATIACASTSRFPWPPTTATPSARSPIVTRGLTAEGGPTELGLPTFPSRRFVRAGGLTFVHEGLLEYELVGSIATPRAMPEPLSWRSRCCGAPACSRRSRWPPVPLPAGPLRPPRGPAAAAAAHRAMGFTAEAGARPLRHWSTTRSSRCSRRQVAPTCPARCTGWKARCSPSTAPRSPRCGAPPPANSRCACSTPPPSRRAASLGDRRGWTTDLRGRPLAPWEGSVELGPWQIATLVLSS